MPQHATLDANTGDHLGTFVQHPAALHIEIAILAILIAALGRMLLLKTDKDSTSLAELRHVARDMTPRIRGRNVVPRQPRVSSQSLGPPS